MRREDRSAGPHPINNKQQPKTASMSRVSNVTLSRNASEECSRHPRWARRATRHTAATGVMAGIAIVLFYLAPEIAAQAPAGSGTGNHRI